MSFLRVFDGNLGQPGPSIKCKIGKQDTPCHRPDHIHALGQRERIMNRRGAQFVEGNLINLGRMKESQRSCLGLWFRMLIWMRMCVWSGGW